MAKTNLKNYFLKWFLAIFLAFIAVIEILIYISIDNISSFSISNTKQAIINSINEYFSGNENGEIYLESYCDNLIKQILTQVINSGIDSPSELKIYIENYIKQTEYDSKAIKNIDYYFINNKLTIFETSYSTDLNLNFAKLDKETFIDFFNNLEPGKIEIQKASFELNSFSVRKFGYLRINNKLIVEIGLLLNSDYIKPLYENIKKLREDIPSITEIGLYSPHAFNHAEDFKPVLNIYKKATKFENDLMLKCLETKKVTEIKSGNKIYIAVPWFKNTNLYTDILITLFQLDISWILNQKLLLFFLILITIIILFFIILKVFNKMSNDVLYPFQAVIKNMENLAGNNNIEKTDVIKPTGITELEDIIKHYTVISDKLNQTMHGWQTTNEELKMAYEEIEKSYNYFVNKLVDLVEGYDENTGNHVERVGILSEYMAVKLGLPVDFAKELRRYAPLHDLGKISVPQSILLKNGKLTDGEWEVMKQHTITGGNLLGDNPVFMIAKNIALYHHEKYNGRGYPFGLSGEDIPIEAQIVSIIDVYDALRSPRPYKLPYTHEETYSIIVDGDKRTAKDDFNPELIKLFKKHEKEIKELWDSNFKSKIKY